MRHDAAFFAASLVARRCPLPRLWRGTLGASLPQAHSSENPDPFQATFQTLLLITTTVSIISVIREDRRNKRATAGAQEASSGLEYLRNVRISCGSHIWCNFQSYSGLLRRSGPAFRTDVCADLRELGRRVFHFYSRQTQNIYPSSSGIFVATASVHVRSKRR